MSRVMGVSEARENFAGLLDHLSEGPVAISRRGHKVAAVVDWATFERIAVLAEDMQDILDAQAARDEMLATKAEPVPWDEVKEDLGLV